jgi:hypothetical protein
MVGQILPNNNESAMGIFPKSFCNLITGSGKEKKVTED